MKKIVICLLCLGIMQCSTVRKMLKREPNAENLQTTSEQITGPTAKPLPRSNFGVIHSSMTFLPSFRDDGGPHIKIDSLNTVIYLNEDVMRAIENYLKTGKQGGSSSPGNESVVRYFGAKYSANDLLAEELDSEKAQGIAHFKGTFDKHGNLMTLEYFGEQQADAPDLKNLKPLYASYWDLFNNQRINYLDDNGNRPEPHIKFFTDLAKNVHRIDYLKNKDIIATGTFMYGVKQFILEQRIVFPNGGKLTDLHPDFFYRQYDRVEQGWVVKCLYEQKNKLSDLFVMQDNGVTFYRYRFIHDTFQNKSVIEAFVYNSENNLIGRYELYFNEDNQLEKKVLISGENEVSAYSTFTLDSGNLKMVVTNFDQSGKQVSRIYREL